MLRMFARLTAVAMAVLAIAGPASAQPKPYTIEVILSLTGSAASLGADEQTGLTAYEKLANRQGGINGTPIHFTVYDDQSNPAVAVQLVNNILVASSGGRDGLLARRRDAGHRTVFQRRPGAVRLHSAALSR